MGAAPEWKRLLARGISKPCDLPAHIAQQRETLGPVSAQYPMLINAYFLSLIKTADDALARQAIPSPAELQNQEVPQDPLNEQTQSPVPGVIHRYPDRVAFLVSDRCAMNCRFCMRKRMAASKKPASWASIEKGIAYIRTHKAIREVILTGGDPLMIDDQQLATLLQRLKAIAHIRVLRLHTRMPSVLPQRITAALVHMLACFKPFYLNVHVNHPAEITSEAVRAFNRLADAGIALGSQTVLLKGVNDNTHTLRELMTSLLENRVRPYYLHQLDTVRGVTHFQVSPDKALTLAASLRGHISGMAVPQLMVDLPGGGGKVALTADVVEKRYKTHWVLRNWQGKTFSYPLYD